MQNFMNINQGIRPYVANKFLKFVIFEVFWGKKSPYVDRSMGNLARRGEFLVFSDVPNLTIIGETCRPCGAKTHKIVP